MKILIIEDNDVLRENIATFLDLQGISVTTHASYDGAEYLILNENFDCIILDLGLGSEEGDGVKICQNIRREGNTTPVIMLTARAMTHEKIEGLKAGADDYMVKPFDYYELLARIEAVVRRDFSNKSSIIRVKNLEIHEDTHEVLQNGEKIELSRQEFRLLLFFAQNSEKVLTKEQIMEKVWGEVDMFRESRSVDIYVGYLRKKLGADVIETVRGVGYKF